jgi:hypothetical protein
VNPSFNAGQRAEKAYDYAFLRRSPPNHSGGIERETE